MIVKVFLKEVYGRPLYYPKNEIAEVLCKILGSQSMGKRQIDILIENGWEVVMT